MYVWLQKRSIQLKNCKRKLHRGKVQKVTKKTHISMIKVNNYLFCYFGIWFWKLDLENFRRFFFFRYIRWHFSKSRGILWTPRHAEISRHQYFWHGTQWRDISSSVVKGLKSVVNFIFERKKMDWTRLDHYLTLGNTHLSEKRSLKNNDEIWLSPYISGIFGRKITLIEIWLYPILSIAFKISWKI